MFHMSKQSYQHLTRMLLQHKFYWIWGILIDTSVQMLVLYIEVALYIRFDYFFNQVIFNQFDEGEC